MDNDDKTPEQEQLERQQKAGIREDLNQAQNAHELGKAIVHPKNTLASFRPRLGLKHSTKEPPGDTEETPPEETNTQDKQKKRKSPFHQVNDVRRTIKNVKTTIQVARTIVSLANPWVAGVIIFIVIIIILFMFFFNGSKIAIPDQTESTTPATPLPPGISINVSASSQVANGENITYTVRVSYDPDTATSPIEKILVYDNLPPNTEFVSATSPPCTLSGNTINCPLAGLANQTTFTIVLRPTKNDTIVTNTIGASVMGTSQTLLGEPTQETLGTKDSLYKNTAPSKSSCDGIYDLSQTPNGVNFGDPLCDFSKDKLYSLLKSLDPENADVLYYKVATCSGYNPNAYKKSPDNQEVFGLFQLRQEGVGKGSYNVGNVAWQNQVINAIYNNKATSAYLSSWTCK